MTRIDVLTFDLVVFLGLDQDFLLTEGIDSFAFPQKHDFQFMAFRVIVYIVSKVFIDIIPFYRNINCHLLLQIQDVCFKAFIFFFSLLNLLEQL